MFVINVTPAIIIAGAAGFGFRIRRADFPQHVYLIQMSMLFAGIATLLQTIGIGPVGARLADCAGHQLCLYPDHDPAGRGQGRGWLAALFGGSLSAGCFHACLGLSLARSFCPAAAGHGPGRHDDRSGAGQGWHPICRRRRAGHGQPEYGSLLNWSAALVVIFVTLALKFFTKGMLSISAVLIGLIVGYIYAWPLAWSLWWRSGGCQLEHAAAWPCQTLPYGFEFAAPR